ncbi:hypothetical protein BDW02DRAFT_620552 [Decorospora gaudefroyi]|uniref:Uncharacterized protein n=1 Tax=Decorospora gaudefroyi TaxID=184978 RepID=A0A6A5KFL6_9PLEO|nr:hypothetical protein BDW02DRAFT_620552 [Decorospora gaudefroyi]
MQREQSKVINFDHHSQTVWDMINERYDGISGSKQCDMSYDVQNQICDIIQSIADQAGVRHMSFATKSSGLETLRKIADTICAGSGDTLGSEVRKQFSHDSTLEDAMLDIVNAMSDEERETMRSKFWLKLSQLKGVADGYCVFEGLDDVMAALLGDFGDEDEE